MILRKECALGLTHRILWKMSLIGQGEVVQHQVISQDQQLITQQAQQKVSTFFIYFFFLLSLHLFLFYPKKYSVCSQEDSSTGQSAFGSGVQLT